MTSPPDAPLLVNKRELATLLKVSLPTLSEMMRRYADFPVERGGGTGAAYAFDAAKVRAFVAAKRADEERASVERAALFEQFRLPVDEVAGEEAKGLTPAQRFALAKARQTEQKLAREAGFLVLASEVRKGGARVLAQLGAFLDVLPESVCRDLELGPEVALAMRARIDRARERFVDELRAVLERGGDGAEA
jgi:phage terminase Nu1 subunit (DNA packaging protein)